MDVHHDADSVKGKQLQIDGIAQRKSCTDSQAKSQRDQRAAQIHRVEIVARPYMLAARQNGLAGRGAQTRGLQSQKRRLEVYGVELHEATPEVL